MRKANARNLTALNELRISKGISQQEIADYLKVSQNTVSTWCNNKTAPNEDQIDALAEMFRVPREEITACIVAKRVKNTSSKGSGIPRAFKDTFWSKMRVENDLKLSEVAEALDVEHKRVARYFSGQSVPTDSEIKIICDLFDVDFTKGKYEFNKAHKAWRGERKRDRSKYISAKQFMDTESEPDKVAPIASAPDKVAPIVPAVTATNIQVNLDKNTASRILANLYGKIDYHYFVAVSKLISTGKSASEILSTLYGVINYDTFIIVANYLNGEG